MAFAINYRLFIYCFHSQKVLLIDIQYTYLHILYITTYKRKGIIIKIEYII